MSVGDGGWGTRDFDEEGNPLSGSASLMPTSLFPGWSAKGAVTESLNMIFAGWIPGLGILQPFVASANFRSNLNFTQADYVGYMVEEDNEESAVTYTPPFILHLDQDGASFMILTANTNVSQKYLWVIFKLIFFGGAI